MDFRAFGIIPAAGSGLRTSLPLPKQFCLVAGRPLIAYTLERFDRLPWMEEIYVAISEDWKDYMETLITQCKLTKIRLILGGTTRHRSIRNCIEELNRKFDTESNISGDSSNQVVIVHDAVRPFVDEDTLKQIAVAAKEHGASGAIRPLVSTVIASDENGILDHSLVRSKYRESHTPQAFRHSIIKTAYEKITEYDLDYGTECLHLALEYTRTKAKLLEAPDEVWKVTEHNSY
ncbi:D-ribitol-5-phosphate cytidylyltransferase-like [Amphiura filiformis]|uniref:D-ribitol-5-phosphate cytidylyltransferase-like n=1 Tax=Amphiura filiformis TaxID=82378 RepID=UPI003B21FBF7